MDRNETKKLLMGIDSIYQVKAAPDLTMKIDLWHSILEDVSLEDALQTLKRHAKTNDFPPKPHTFTKIDADVEAGPAVPTYDDTMLRLYVDEHYDKVVNPETLQVIDYVPKKKKTEQEEKEQLETAIINKVLISKKIGYELTEKQNETFQKIKESNPGLVESVTKQFNVSSEQTTDSINMKQMREDRAKGERRLAEIRKSLTN